MSHQSLTGLGCGERAPDFVAPVEDGSETRFYARAGGRPALLLFTSSGSHAVFRVAMALADRASLHLVVPEGRLSTEDLRTSENQFLKTQVPTAPASALDDTDLFQDDGVVREAFRLPAGDSIHAVLLDRNLRAVITVPFDDPEAIERLDEATRHLMVGDTASTITAQAPVLFIPRVLEPMVCAHLQQVWETSHDETGVERSVDASRREVIEAAAKKRQDHVVAEEGLVRVLTQSIGRRVIPEVRRMFGYEADRFEGFKISCYESASSGFFHAHRDNLSPATAHRRFAMSLNLNSDYAGGELRFPEFGDFLYRPNQGEALIFACSMLHEVVPVTQGRRFNLLSFLFSADSQRRPSGLQPQAAKQE